MFESPNLSYIPISPTVAIAAEYIIDRVNETNAVLETPLPRFIHVAVWRPDMESKNRARVGVDPLNVDALPFATEGDKATLRAALGDLIARRGVQAP